MSESVDQLTSALQAFEDYRVKMREWYAVDRLALVEIFQQIMAKPIPKNAGDLSASLGGDMVVIAWEPRDYKQINRFRGRNPINYYMKAGIIPRDGDLYSALCISDDKYSFLLSAITTDLLVDAWKEAGGYNYSARLVLHRTLMVSPDVPIYSIESMKDIIRQSVAAVQAGKSNVPVRKPLPSKLPSISQKNHDACKTGAPDALANWAADLEISGHAEGAQQLRWLEDISNRIAKSVQVWINQGAFYIYSEWDTTWWGIGEDSFATPGENTPDTIQLGNMLAAWKDFHPAFEWFFRKFGFAEVTVRCCWTQHGMSAHRTTYNLAAGEHLVPYEDTVGIVEVSANCPYQE